MLKLLPHYKGEPISGIKFPLYSSESIATELKVGGHMMIVRTGVELALPVGKLLLVTGLPGFAHTHGIVMVCPTVYGQDNFGELKVLLQNIGNKNYVLVPGSKVGEASIIRSNLI